MISRPRSLALLGISLLSLAVASAACGGGGHGGGSTPTPTPTATGTPAPVHVALPANPATGVTIAVENSSGAVVSTAILPTSGADVFVPTGGSLTAYYTDGYTRYASHVVEPPPGASILFANLTNPLGSGFITNGDMTVTTNDPDVTGLLWTGQCGSGSSSGSVGNPLVQTGVEFSCTRDPFDIFALGRSATNEGLVWGALLDVEPTGGYLNLSVAATNATFDEYRVVATNIPNGVDVNTYSFVHRLPVDNFSGVGSGSTLTGVTSGTGWTLAFPAGLGRVVHSEVGFLQAPGPNSVGEEDVIRAAADGATDTFDVGAIAADLPVLSTPVLTTGGTAAISWTASAAPFAPTLIDAEASWSSNGAAYVQHVFWAPPGWTSVSFPQVPAGFEGWLPLANVQYPSVYVLVGNRSDAPSYAGTLAQGGIFSQDPAAVSTPIVLEFSSASN